jgi:hypothetical protein
MRLGRKCGRKADGKRKDTFDAFYAAAEYMIDKVYDAEQ